MGASRPCGRADARVGTVMGCCGAEVWAACTGGVMGPGRPTHAVDVVPLHLDLLRQRVPADQVAAQRLCILLCLGGGDPAGVEQEAVAGGAVVLVLADTCTATAHVPTRGQGRECAGGVFWGCGC